MSIEIENMEKSTPNKRLRCAIVGPEKGGKSRLAATGRKKVLFFDFDQRRESVAGQPGVYAITFRDSAKSYEQPTAFNEMLDFIEKLERSCSAQALGLPDATPMDVISTIVFDSIQTMAKCAMNYALYSTKEIRREINIGGKMVIRFPSGWDGWSSEMQMVESALLRVMAIPTLDVIAILHEVSEESPDSTAEKTILTGKYNVYPVRYRSILKYFNELWRVTRETGNIPAVQLTPTWKFTAATALGITEKDIIGSPNIESMINLCNSRGKINNK